MIFQNCLKFHSPNGSWNYVQFWNITHGIYANYHYKSFYYLYKLDVRFYLFILISFLDNDSCHDRKVSLSWTLFMHEATWQVNTYTTAIIVLILLARDLFKWLSSLLFRFISGSLGTRSWHDPSLHWGAWKMRLTSIYSFFKVYSKVVNPWM